MPDPNAYSNQDEWMEVCIPKLIAEGNDQDQAAAICAGMWRDKNQAAKYRLTMGAVKAVGDWELDVLAIPFGEVDGDGQWFDEHTDIMADAFKTPLGFYQHGIKQGGQQLDERPTIVARPVEGSLEQHSDGWHLRYILDQTVKVARDIMEAARRGLVAVSSDSIAHLARLDIGGKLIQYEKNRPGRIAVWPLAGVSMWELGNGNFKPASRSTYALPAMKAIYREAGLDFPNVDTHGADQAEATARQRAQVIARAQKVLSKKRS